MLGKFYDHEIWLVGLKRIESIEDELRKREVKYG